MVPQQFIRQINKQKTTNGTKTFYWVNKNKRCRYCSHCCEYIIVILFLEMTKIIKGTNTVLIVIIYNIKVRIFLRKGINIIFILTLYRADFFHDP